MFCAFFSYARTISPYPVKLWKAGFFRWAYGFEPSLITLECKTRSVRPDFPSQHTTGVRWGPDFSTRACKQHMLDPGSAEQLRAVWFLLCSCTGNALRKDFLLRETFLSQLVSVGVKHAKSKNKNKNCFLFCFVAVAQRSLDPWSVLVLSEFYWVGRPIAFLVRCRPE
jgi:hypothetical protein